MNIVKDQQTRNYVDIDTLTFPHLTSPHPYQEEKSVL